MPRGLSSRSATKLALAADRLSDGDLDVKIEAESHDEIGETARRFQTLVEALRGMTMVANAIAHGDLGQNFEPRSEADVLGFAIRDMLLHLRAIVGQVRESTGAIDSSTAGIQGGRDEGVRGRGGDRRGDSADRRELRESLGRRGEHVERHRSAGSTFGKMPGRR